ncbi:MAG: M16 family metallopeptidase [Candidatus Methylomirabilales bacterium]
MRRARWIPVAALLLTLLAHGAEAGGLDVFATTLDNGLKVLLLEEHKAPVVTFHIWYRVGSRNEQIGRTGLAHLVEHMMFKGTERIGSQEFSRRVRRNGGRDNAFTSQDYTGYFVTIAADRIQLPLELEPDRMVNLRLDPAEVKRERSVVMEERRLRTEDDPSSALWEEVQAAAFKAYPYGHPVIGWMEDLRQLTRTDVQNFYKTYYVPNNAVVVVVGDFDRTQLLPRIQEAFGSISRAPDPPPVRSDEPPQKGERRIMLTRPDARLPSLVAGYHVPNLKDPDGYALDVIEVILAGGKSARLYRNLVYEKQLALGAGAYYARVSAAPDLFNLYASPLPGKSVEELEQALFDEIEQLKTELVSARELQKAKNQIEASFVFSQDSIFSLARQLASYEMVAGWRYWEAYLPGIRAVTREDVQRVAQKYFTRQKRTVGVLIPGDQQSAVGGQQSAVGN